MSNVSLCFFKVTEKNVGKPETPRNNVSANSSKRMPLLTGLYRWCVNGRYWTKEYKSKKDRQVDLLPLASQITLRGFLHVVTSNSVQLSCQPGRNTFWSY